MHTYQTEPEVQEGFSVSNATNGTNANADKKIATFVIPILFFEKKKVYGCVGL